MILFLPLLLMFVFLSFPLSFSGVGGPPFILSFLFSQESEGQLSLIWGEFASPLSSSVPFSFYREADFSLFFR